MIAALLALAVPALPPALGAIGRQQLPDRGCAAFLWTLDETPRLVAMVSAEPARLRLALDGAAATDLPLVARTGEAGQGLAASADYRAGDTAATLALTVAPRPDLTQGAGVPQATLTLTRPGHDALVMPLAGLIGCRPVPAR